ncbi:hypothetical protein KIN20_000077 [Parelaphostrongylus tenuis]|uniref:Uncharacterized protein n=1 Tax=Parelaphostrongylus tenuis TaxID=148309 RepID=A0AAD5QBJ9_PARTN|nr:hypothetical protein KIN20_000077 [Parelaphostrongylus tenuis]
MLEEVVVGGHEALQVRRMRQKVFEQLLLTGDLQNRSDDGLCWMAIYSGIDRSTVSSSGGLSRRCRIEALRLNLLQWEYRSNEELHLAMFLYAGWFMRDSSVDIFHFSVVHRRRFSSNESENENCRIRKKKCGPLTRIIGSGEDENVKTLAE